MQMRNIIRGVLAAGLLAAGSAAQAAMTLPSDTTTGSSLFVTVFDVTNGESFTTDLGLDYSDFVTLSGVSSTPNSIKAAAFTPLSFNLDMSIFGDNDPSNLRYNIYAGDSAGGNGVKGLLITATAAPSLSNGQMNGVNTQAASLIATFNQNCPSGNTCAGGFGSETLWGSTINGQVAGGTAAPLGTALAFYSITGANTLSSTAGATATQFANAQGNWAWQLSSNGALTFSGPSAPEVPLPAAAWLMLSGLAGVGAVGRRSAKKA